MNLIERYYGDRRLVVGETCWLGVEEESCGGWGGTYLTEGEDRERVLVSLRL